MPLSTKVEHWHLPPRAQLSCAAAAPLAHTRCTSPRRCTFPQNGTQLLFLGDSITEGWRGTVCGIPCHPALQLQCDACVGGGGRRWLAGLPGVGGTATALALTSKLVLIRQTFQPAISTPLTSGSQD